jgi:DNA repair protein RadC
MTLISTHLLPREKIQDLGVEMLSTEELLSVLLGSGSEHVPVTVIAKRVAAKLLNKKRVSLNDFMQIKGVGLAKACQVLAAIELVERLRPSGQPLLDSVQKVLMQVGELRYADREQVLCLYLNARLQLIHKELLALGNLNTAIIAPRDIFSVIKNQPVASFILVHNHPSGDPTPSKEDLRFTHRIAAAGDDLGVPLVDHIIVSREKHYSCKEGGVLCKNE